MTPLRYDPISRENGDDVFAVYDDETYLGRARFNPRVSQWHAVCRVNGALRSRYFMSKAAASRWLRRNARRA